MLRGVSLLRSAGVPIGLIWTLTQTNAHELADVYAYAQRVAAAFVQVHPLESVGYAADSLAAAIPNADELLVAGLFASELFDEMQGEIPIHLDAASSAALADQVLPAGHSEAPLSKLVDPLVVRPDGLVVPGNYALPPTWALGRLTEAPLSTLVERWRARGLSEWKELIDATLASLPGEETLVNFGARLLVTAQRLSGRSVSE